VAPSRPAGRTTSADFGLEMEEAEQPVAKLEPGPARLTHGTPQVAGARPTGQGSPGPARPGPEESPRRSRRAGGIEHDQGRTALSGASGEPPRVRRVHRSFRGEANEVDGLEQRRDDALPAALRTWSRDKNETVEIGSHLDRGRKAELGQTDHGTPVAPRRGACEQQEQQARQSRCPPRRSIRGDARDRVKRVWCCEWPEQDRAASREATAREKPGQLR